MKRVPTTELLDSDAGTPAEITTSLADLRRVNRWFGGVATTEAMIERVARQLAVSQLSLLEIAAGSGDVPKLAAARLRRRGINVNVMLLDRARSHLNSSNRAVVGDALALPFCDASFDVLSCGLFAHHLAPPQFAEFVREGLRVCRRALLINDLIRSRVHLMLVYAGYPLYRSRLTWHDGPASVRQAYTIEEMRTMIAGIPGARVEIHRHYLYRMGVIVWKDGKSHGAE
ncbi:MAG TPA: methyltransferase domain-containing protein [Terriglobales bacterium]|jgi:methyltransferase family protein|nr:methyltransferase domain-containing protein [Terriglobales bacterium]